MINEIFLEPVMYVYVLSGENLKKKSNNEDYWKIKVLTTLDSPKEIDLKIWECGPNPSDNNDLPQKGDYLKIIIENLEEFEKEYKLPASRFSSTIGRGKNLSNIKIDKSKIPEEYLNKLVLKCASPKQIKKAWSIIDSNEYWECEENYKFIMTVLDRVGRKKIEEAPAAKSCHHNYKGGLLIHTSEVLRSARYNVLSKQPHYDFINYDVVCGAAILHDIGKINTFMCDELNVPDSSEEESLLGHPYYSMFYIKKIAEEINFENKEYIKELLHCVASHHGRPEWGAIKEAKTPEALILHDADNESSTIESFKDLLLKSTNDQKFMKHFGDNFYITYKAKKMKSEGKLN
jgi:CRISPR-associated endonuclease Cas3-HD